MDKFIVGEKVEHKLSGNWLTVLEVNGSTLVCRTKDFKKVELFDWEVRKV